MTLCFPVFNGRYSFSSPSFFSDDRQQCFFLLVVCACQIPKASLIKTLAKEHYDNVSALYLWTEMRREREREREKKREPENEKNMEKKNGICLYLHLHIHVVMATMMDY
jgi:hypothetical protein